MFDRGAFRKYLRRAGKREHVADDLCERVAAFEAGLLQAGRSLDEAGESDVRRLAEEAPGQRNNDLRAIALYFRFAGRPELAGAAGRLREESVAGARAPFPLRKFQGVDPEHMAALARDGIVNVTQMIERGKTPADRRALADKTRVPLAAIEEYVKLSDISRVGAIKAKRARLYVDAGLDTVDRMASVTSEELRRIVTEHIRRSGFEGVPTLPKEAENAVRTARSIQRLVVWE